MSSDAQEALRNFRWAGGVTDDSRNAPAGESQSTWTRWTSLAGAYVPLRSNDRSNEEEAYFALSRWERCILFIIYISRLLDGVTYSLPRLLGFGACLLGAAACFLVAFISLPLLAIRPAKFALAFR
jgi:hypothetical protein